LKKIRDAELNSDIQIQAELTLNKELVKAYKGIVDEGTVVPVNEISKV